ncbi:zinc finger domain-containing protein [Nitrospirillum viridazoti]|uniref:DNA-binding phage zinc finger domain-containing protein n=1 Tax=Nitrospirillum viridazoti CBAmc TaxID=1441467 RepID=A0A248JTF9_9PROT|nr:hypothetical protein Y958_11590 [Nitrospirillum amazonense CBAmc]
MAESRKPATGADRRRQRRDDAIAQKPCPTCGVAEGQRCVGGRGQQRTSIHQGRWAKPPRQPGVAVAGLGRGA